MYEVEGARSIQTASDGADHACSPCRYEEEEKKATSVCEDCKEYLCQSCSTSHRGLKVTRNHKLLPITECSVTSFETSADPHEVICECSRNVVVSAYCEDHVCVICQSCETVKHTKCNTIPISKQVASYSIENFHLISQKANEIVAEVDMYVECRQYDIQCLPNIKDKCIKDIKAFRQNINGVLDTLEKESLEALEKQGPAAQQIIERHLPACISTKEMLQTDMELFDHIKKSSSKADMFAADILLSNRFKEYDKFLRDITDITKSPKLYFEKSNQLNDILVNVKNLGSIVSDDKLFTDLKIVNSECVDIKMRGDNTCPTITGCALMPDGKIVICDHKNYSLKVFSDSFQTYEALLLSSAPFDVSVANDTGVITTVPSQQQLQYIQVSPTLKTGFMAQLDQYCWGIDVVDKEVYVACHDNPGNGQIQILDIKGIFKRTIALATYDRPTCISVNARSGKIYISDKDNSSVACLMPSGEVVYEYKDQYLVYPRKVCVDKEDNIIVCDENCATVQIITAAGDKHSTLLTTSDGILNPFCALYRHMDNTLIIAGSGTDKLQMTGNSYVKSMHIFLQNVYTSTN